MRRLSSKAKNSPASKTEVAKRSKPERTSAAAVRYGEADSDEESDSGKKEEEDAFEVEAVIDSRFVHGKHQFKIRWKGYGPGDDSWENEDNLDCPDLIAAFQKESIKEEKKASKRSTISPDKGKKNSKKSKKSPSTKSDAQNGNDNEVEIKKTRKTSTKSNMQDEDDDEDEDAEWEVSKVIDFVELKDGTRQFLVRWKGYSAKHDSWEPEANLNCSDLIEKFLASEKERDEVGREVRAVRKQVNRYNPELTKRHSHRTSSRKRIFYYDQE